MPSPEFPLQTWEFFHQLARTPSFDAPHDFARSHRRGRTHQNMDVVATHYALQNLDLKGVTGLPDQLPCASRDITTQDVLPVVGGPYKVVFNVVGGMASVAVFHSSSVVAES